MALAEVEGFSPETTTCVKRKNTLSNGDIIPNKIFKHDSKVIESSGLKHIGNFEFHIDSEGYVIVYTDGSCFNNGHSNACAGFGVWFGNEHPL